MPYKVRKVRNQDCYKTYNTETKRVFAKCTTKEKALRQLATIRRKVYGTSKSPPAIATQKSKVKLALKTAKKRLQ